MNSKTSPIVTENAIALVIISDNGMVNGTNKAISPKKSNCFVNVLPSKSPIPTSLCPELSERKMTIKSGICAPMPRMMTETINDEILRRFDISMTPKISHRELNNNAPSARMKISPSFHILPS